VIGRDKEHPHILFAMLEQLITNQDLTPNFTRRSFQLRATKTPITAAGGLLHEVFFIVGSGAGCVWVEEYGGKWLVEPSYELSAVSYCDDKKNADAVVDIQVDPFKTLGLIQFQSGRIDLFAMDGPRGKPKRRPVLNEGARSIVFHPIRDAKAFVVATGATGARPPRVIRWDVSNRQPVLVGEYDISADASRIDFIGISVDGESLVALDSACVLRIWDFETREPLLSRPAGDLPCPPVADATESRTIEESTPIKSVAEKPQPPRETKKTSSWTGGEYAQIQVTETLDASGLNEPLPILRAKKMFMSMDAGEVLQVIATDPDTVRDFPAFCRQTGTICLQMKEEGGKFFFLLEKP